MFELGEELFDRVEVGAVGWQEQQVRAGVANGSSDGFSLVAAEIVEHHNVARTEGRDQRLLDPGAEALAVNRAIEQTRGFHAVAA